MNEGEIQKRIVKMLTLSSIISDLATDTKYETKRVAQIIDQARKEWCEATTRMERIDWFLKWIGDKK